MNKELAKTLTLALVQFIDSERPEGTMDCSSAECKSIEEMFEGDQFDIIEAFIKKKLSRLTEFEKGVDNAFICVGLENVPYSTVKRIASELLYIARKQLLSCADESNLEKLPEWLKNELARKHLEGCTKGYKEGYNKGYEVATKLYESVAYHFPIMPAINIPTWTPPCYYGGPCTNPQMDCISCPRRTTGGMFSTSSGTSTSKAEG